MSPLEFVHEGRPGRVVFGAGSLAHLEREVLSLGAERALVVCSLSQRGTADAIAARLGRRSAGLFDRATMHVPIELAREARALAIELQADCAIVVGGGSAIGLGKAIALESAIPIVAIPTTYAGSEMTPIYGLTEGGRKRTGTDPRVLPRTVIYDPELSRTLPIDVSVTSAFNAIAHAAEGLYARDADPITMLMAEEAIRTITAALPALATAADDIELRSALLCGAWLAGSVLGAVGMALHHRICHVLGGRLDLPHAATHAVVLPHALAYSAADAPDAMLRIGRALGTTDAPAGLRDLARRIGAPLALRELGMTGVDVDSVADDVATNPPWNPRPIERDAIRALLSRALVGDAPAP